MTQWILGGALVLIVVACLGWIRSLQRQFERVANENQTLAERSRALQAEKQVEHLTTLQGQMAVMMHQVQQRMDAMGGAVGDRVHRVQGTLDERLGMQTKLMGEVQQQLGALGEATKNLQNLGQEVGSLTSLLRAPKLRGNLGELLLEDVLRQVLPRESVTMQYRFQGDSRGTVQAVDAVIHLGDRLVPVDAKFPLESFERLLNSGDDADRLAARKAFLEVVRAHIDSIAEKYIRPEQGTYDFALMYMPAENMYYEAVVRTDDAPIDIVAHATKKKVIPVSPNTLYAYLLTVAYGLKGMQIEKKAETIRGDLAGFQRRFAQVFTSFEKVGRNLDLAYRGYETVAKDVRKLDISVGKITGELQFDEEALSLPAPDPSLNDAA